MIREEDTIVGDKMVSKKRTMKTIMIIVTNITITTIMGMASILSTTFLHIILPSMYILTDMITSMTMTTIMRSLFGETYLQELVLVSRIVKLLLIRLVAADWSSVRAYVPPVTEQKRWVTPDKPAKPKVTLKNAQKKISVSFLRNMLS
jgi:hypothetical protein